jgi:hypothetical protein
MIDRSIGGVYRARHCCETTVCSGADPPCNGIRSAADPHRHRRKPGMLGDSGKHGDTTQCPRAKEAEACTPVIAIGRIEVKRDRAPMLSSISGYGAHKQPIRRWDIELRQNLTRACRILRWLRDTSSAARLGQRGRLAKPASRCHVLCKAHFPRLNCQT